jgi:broad specificity phosphatase PhoE
MDQVTRRQPRKIVLIRHGQSQGNVDKNRYMNTPDPEIALTDTGHKQASEAGEKRKEKETAFTDVRGKQTSEAGEKKK